MKLLFSKLKIFLSANWLTNGQILATLEEGSLIIPRLVTTACTILDLEVSGSCRCDAERGPWLQLGRDL